MDQKQAEVIALQGLTWLAGDDALCSAFLGASGGSVDDLRQRATDPAFQAAVLAFITMDDTSVMAFCDSIGLAYDQPLRARYALPGGESVHWT